MNHARRPTHSFGSCGSRRWALASTFTLIVLIVEGGCGGDPQLMPTPNLYAWGKFDPFAEVPPELQTSGVDVMYLTDRAREEDSPNGATYGYKRSRSAAFGISQLAIGDGVSWEQLVAASRTSKRSIKLPLKVTKTTELGRLPPVPPKLFVATTGPATGPSSRPSEGGADAAQATLAEAQRTLSGMLAKSPVKEVYIFVHGYSNTFEDSIITVGQLWHFFGRRGVALAYSWPAGRPGLLRGYNYDFQSSQFTVYHMKQALRQIALNPDVQKVHILAHSRGTDVVAAALRELHLEITASGRSTREVLKLGTVVLAAPDLDMDVVISRLATAQLGHVPERAAVYVCSKDKALGISKWLFGGIARLGEIEPDVFTREEIDALHRQKTPQFIDAQVSTLGAFGHGYFHANPAVSSDLILLMRYHLGPGAECGRPLGLDPKGFWVIDDKYPKRETADEPALAEAER
jgi:esterase/lipase superfamily enzyme